MGIIKSYIDEIGSSFFFIADDSLPLMKTSVDNFNTHYFVQADIEDLHLIKDKIYEATNQRDNVQVSTINNTIDYIEKSINRYKVLLYGLIAFIAVFGFINFINTFMTNYITRKQEFGMLQSMGMSNQQLYVMLRTESLFYVIGTFIITITVGSGCGFLLVKAFNQFKIFGELIYRFPVVPIIAYFSLLLFIQWIFSKAIISNNQKQPLIERIKVVE